MTESIETIILPAFTKILCYHYLPGRRSLLNFVLLKIISFIRQFTVTQLVPLKSEMQLFQQKDGLSTVSFVGPPEGIRFARLRAFGRSRSQRSTGALLCAARPSSPAKKKNHRLSDDNLWLLVAETGLEPATSGLWARRATNCSTPRYLIFECFIIIHAFRKKSRGFIWKYLKMHFLFRKACFFVYGKPEIAAFDCIRSAFESGCYYFMPFFAVDD